MSESPIYQRIADDLRSAIDGGEFAPGQRLPGALMLAHRFDASPNTIRQALNALARQGVVRTQPGVGTFVANKIEPVELVPSPPEAEEPPDRDTEEGDLPDEEGPSTAHSLRIGIEPATAFVAELLEIAEGASVVVRSWVRLNNDRPWAIQRSYFPHDLVEGTAIMEPESIDGGTIQVLADNGHPQVRCNDMITAEIPTPGDRQTLELDEGVPVLVLDRISADSERPIRLNRSFYPADRHRLIYNVL